MNLENLAKLRAMEQAYLSSGAGRLVDMVLDDPDMRPKGMKRVQFDTSSVLKERLEGLCGLLNVSQREFLETALVDALDLAETTYFKTFRDVAGFDFGDASESEPASTSAPDMALYSAMTPERAGEILRQLDQENLPSGGSVSDERQA